MLTGRFEFRDDTKFLSVRISTVEISNVSTTFLSMDEFEKLNGSENYRGSFRATLENSGSEDAYVGVIDKHEGFSNISVGDRITISVTDQNGAKKISVSFIDSGDVVRHEFDANSEPGELRTVNVIYDKQAGLSESTKLEEVEAIDLPGYLRHTFASVMKEASIKVNVTTPNEPFSNSLVGEENIWTSDELLSALRSRTMALQLGKPWSVWLFEASAYERRDVLGTLISSSADVFQRRRGCAIFTGLIRGIKQDRDRVRLRTAIHELGHCFNLVHTDSRTSVIDDSPCFMDPGYFLDAPYWNQFPFTFNQDSILEIQHAFFGDICPGESEFKDPSYVFQSSLAPNVPGIALEFQLEKSIVIGEPLLLKISAVNNSEIPRLVPDTLNPSWNASCISVSDGKKVKFFRALLNYCGKPNNIRLKPNESLTEFVWLHSNESQLFFADPGRYSIQVFWKPDEQTVLSAPPQDILVDLPKSREEMFVAERFSDRMIGELFETDGSDCPFLAKPMEQLQEVSSNWPDTRIGKKCATIIGTNANRSFKRVTETCIEVGKKNLDVSVFELRKAMTGQNGGVSDLVAQFAKSKVGKFLRSVDHKEAQVLRREILLDQGDSGRSDEKSSV